MLHRQFFAILIAAFALANSAYAMDENEKRKKIEAARSQLNMGAATIIHYAQQIDNLLHPRSNEQLDPKELLKRDDTITCIPRPIKFKEALQSLQNNCDSLMPLLTDDAGPLVGNNTPHAARSTIVPTNIISVLRDALESASSKLRRLNSNPQACINASKLLGIKHPVNLSECILGIGHASKLLFTEKATDFPPAILLEHVYPASICLVSHSTVHGMPSHCHAILQKVVLPYEIIKNVQTKEAAELSEKAKRALVSDIKKAICNRLLNSATDLIQYENGIPVKVRPFGHANSLYPADYVRLRKVNGSYFLNGCIIPDENVLFPPGCFELEVFTSVAHNNYKLLCASCVGLEGSDITLNTHLAHQGNRWVVGSYNNDQYTAGATIQTTSNSNYVPPMSIVWNGNTCELDGTPVSAEALAKIFNSPGNNITFTSYVNNGAHKYVLVNTHPDTDKHTQTRIHLTRINAPYTPNNPTHAEWQILPHDHQSAQNIIKTIAYRLSNNKPLRDDEVQIVWWDGKCYMNGTEIDPALLFPEHVKQVSFGLSRSNKHHIHADIQKAQGKAGEITSSCFEVESNKWKPVACTITHLKGSRKHVTTNDSQAPDVRSPRSTSSDSSDPAKLKERSDTVELIVALTQEKQKTEKSSSLSKKLRTSNKKFLVSTRKDKGNKE